MGVEQGVAAAAEKGAAAAAERASCVFLGDLALVVAAVVVAVLAYLLVRRGLKQLLDDVVKLPAARKFYLRTLLVVMVLSALAATVSVGLGDMKEARFMEKIWKIAESLDGAFWAFMVVLLIYAVLQTVLVAALRRHHEP